MTGPVKIKGVTLIAEDGTQQTFQGSGESRREKSTVKMDIGDDIEVDYLHITLNLNPEEPACDA